MTKVTFFQNRRRDGAVRSGVEVNEELFLQKYVPGAEERDSALVWYVDVRCTAEDAASTTGSENVRTFFERIGGQIKQALGECAEELAAGMDSEIWPLRKKITGLPEGIQGEVVCSAMRRVTDGELAKVLRQLADTWTQTLQELEDEPAPVA